MSNGLSETRCQRRVASRRRSLFASLEDAKQTRTPAVGMVVSG